MGDAQDDERVERVERIRFFVPGTPIPQGSKRAYVVGKRAVVVDSNADKLKPWREKVTAAATVALAGRSGFSKDADIAVLYDFYFTVPKTVTRNRPNVRVDLDKLERAIGDALTDAGVWVDDGQVVNSHTQKWYAETPGVHITVLELA